MSKQKNIECYNILSNSVSLYDEYLPTTIDREKFKRQIQSNSQSNSVFKQYSKHKVDLYYGFWYYEYQRLSTLKFDPSLLTSSFHHESLIESIGSIVVSFNNIIKSNFLQCNCNCDSSPAIFVKETKSYRVNGKFISMIINSTSKCLKILLEKFNIMLSNEEALVEDLCLLYHNEPETKKNTVRCKKYIDSNKGCYQFHIENLRNIMIPLLRECLLINISASFKNECNRIISADNNFILKKKKKNGNSILLPPCIIKPNKNSYENNYFNPKLDKVQFPNTISNFFDIADNLITNKQMILLYDFVHDYLHTAFRDHKKKMIKEAPYQSHCLKCMFTHIFNGFWEIFTFENILKIFKKVMVPDILQFNNSMDFLYRQKLFTKLLKIDFSDYENNDLDVMIFGILHNISTLFHISKTEISKLLFFYLNCPGNETETGKRENCENFHTTYNLENQNELIIDEKSNSNKEIINETKTINNSIFNSEKNKKVLNTKKIEEYMDVIMKCSKKKYSNDFELLQIFKKESLNNLKMNSRCMNHLKKYILYEEIKNLEKNLVKRLSDEIINLYKRAENAILDNLYQIIGENNIENIFQSNKETLIKEIILSLVPLLLLPLNNEVSFNIRNLITNDLIIKNK